MSLFKQMMNKVNAQDVLLKVSEETAFLILAAEEKVAAEKRRKEEEIQEQRVALQDAMAPLVDIAVALQATAYDPETATGIVRDVEAAHGTLAKIVMGGRPLTIIDHKQLPNGRGRTDQLNPLKGNVFAAHDLLRRVGYLAGILESKLEEILSSLTDRILDPNLAEAQEVIARNKERAVQKTVKVYSSGKDFSSKIGDVVPKPIAEKASKKEEGCGELF